MGGVGGEAEDFWVHGLDRIESLLDLGKEFISALLLSFKVILELAFLDTAGFVI